ncbi:hypothetical protein [Lysobacter gummosus]|uniref:hypothetical protein n=1 Tax=Lysobacter gummosus TaxID=262324 RepID=UPI00363CF0D6
MECSPIEERDSSGPRCQSSIHSWKQLSLLTSRRTIKPVSVSSQASFAAMTVPQRSSAFARRLWRQPRSNHLS